MTFPVQYPRLKTQHLIDFLEPLLFSGAPLFPGRLPTAQPNRAIALIPTSGRGYDQEGEFDNPSWLIQCRGGADNFSDAEDIAYEVDSVILRAPTNFDIADSVHVDFLDRVSGAPTAPPITDAMNRWVFSCSYKVRVSTNL
jgi:hypothetical protein